MVNSSHITEVRVPTWAEVGRVVYMKTRHTYGRGWSDIGQPMVRGVVARTTKTQVTVQFETGSLHPTPSTERRFVVPRYGDRIKELGSNEWNETLLVSQDEGEAHNNRVHERTQIQKAKNKLDWAWENYRQKTHGWRADVDAVRELIEKANAVVEIYGEQFDQEKAEMEAKTAMYKEAERKRNEL